MDVNFNGLLDSGADVSVLGNNAHKIFIDLGFKVQRMSQPTFASVADDYPHLCDKFISLPIEFRGHIKLINFIILPQISLPVHFGLDFFRAFRIARDVISSIQTVQSPTNSFTLNSITSNNVGIQEYTSLSPSERSSIDNLILKFEEINSNVRGLGRTHLITHDIDTGDAKPIKQKYYRLSPEKQVALEAELDKMLSLKVVEPSYSPWNSPVVMAAKSDGKLRLCLDSRKLNAVSKPDAYPLPYINYILDNLRDARYLTSLDLTAAYWQIGLTERSKEKTAFTVPGRGLYHYNVMCFGLVGASATMQRLMDNLFAGFDNKVFAFVDDIVIATSTFEEHTRLLEAVREKLKFANLTINMEKSKFCRSELKYLGYVVDKFGLRTDPSKIEAIVNFPVPKDPKEVKRFLGMCGWYRRFIDNFSKIARPLSRLTSKRVEFNWTEETNTSFNLLKSALVTAPILRCPDFSKPFYIQTDASAYAIGGVLTQKFDDVDHPIAFCSRTLNAQEINYSTTERELLAVIYALEQYRAYVEGTKCYVVTDHASLQWFQKLQNPSGRLCRWACRLSQFNFDIIHRKGKDHVIPDCLSRVHINSINVCNINDKWYHELFDNVKNKPQKFPNYKIENGRIFRLSKNKYNLTSACDWKQVVPEDSRKEILQKLHDEPSAGHFGVAKTHKRVASHYFWPSMFQDVKKYVAACEVCNCYKPINTAQAGLMGQPRQVTQPWEAISCDLMGPLPVSSNRNQFLFVVSDYFSKYTLLFPLRSSVTKHIVKCLEKGVFLLHGTPKIIFCDNGPQFVSKEFQELIKKYNVPHIFYNPRYHPQTNQTERVNRDIGRAIASYVRSDHRKWDQNISEIQCAINTAIHEGTKFSPYSLVHGRDMILDGSLYCSDDPIDPNQVTIVDPTSFSDSLGNLKNIFVSVRANLKRAHEHNSKYYNLRKRPVQLQVGQFAYKRCFPLSSAIKHFSAKLAPKFEKCIISDKHSPVVYSLKSLDGKDLGKFHIKDIVRYD